MRNGEGVKITHTGIACIKGERKLYLNNLLMVPQIKKNLLSVSQFVSDDNVYFEFDTKHCLVRDILTKEILLQGEAVKGLYRFNLVESRNSNADKCVENCNFFELAQSEKKLSNFDIWHYKLGHPSANIVKKVLSENKIPFDVILPYICTFCQMGKESQIIIFKLCDSI